MVCTVCYKDTGFERENDYLFILLMRVIVKSCFEKFIMVNTQQILQPNATWKRQSL